VLGLFKEGKVFLERLEVARWAKKILPHFTARRFPSTPEEPPNL
jgi:hypothetical protein